MVVPVFNVAPYLARCVDSILQQDHASLQVILVDDGSTDGSGEMCDGFEDPRIEVIHQVNAGLSEARNTGMGRVAGEYVTFVDSDDWLAPDFVSRLLHLLVEHDADTAVAGLLRTSDEAATIAVVSGEVRVLDRDQAMMALNGALHTVLTVAWAKLYRTSTLKGVTFPPGRLHEDEFTTYRALAASRRVVVSDRQLYFYWQRPDSITGMTPKQRNWSDVIAAYRERQEFLESGFSDDVAVLGRVELFRKLMHFRQWLGEDQTEERARTLAEMRRLEQSLKGARCSVRLFCAAYVRFPRLIDRLQAQRLRLRRS